MSEVSGLRHRVPAQPVAGHSQQTNWTLTSHDKWKLQLTEQRASVNFKLFNPKGDAVDYHAEFFKAPTFLNDPIEDVRVVMQKIKQLENDPNQEWGFWVVIRVDHKTKEETPCVVFGDRKRIGECRVMGYFQSASLLMLAGIVATETAPIWVVGGLLGAGGGIINYLQSANDENFSPGSLLKEASISGAGSALGGRVSQMLPVTSWWGTVARNLGSSISIQCAGSMVREGKLPSMEELKINAITGMGGSFFQQAVSHSLNRTVTTVSHRILAGVIAGMGGSAFSTTSSNMWRGRDWSENMIFSVLLGGYSAGVYDVHQLMRERAEIAQREQEVEVKEKALLEKAEKEFGKIVDEKLAAGQLPDDPELQEREAILRALARGKEVVFKEEVEDNVKLSNAAFGEEWEDIHHERTALENRKIAQAAALKKEEEAVDALRQERDRLTSEWRDLVEKNHGGTVDALIRDGWTLKKHTMDREWLIHQIAQGQDLHFRKGSSDFYFCNENYRDTYHRANAAAARYDEVYKIYVSHKTDFEGIGVALKPSYDRIHAREAALRKAVEEKFGAQVDAMMKTHYLKDKNISRNREAILGELAKGEKLHFHSVCEKDVKLQHLPFKGEYWAIQGEKEKIELLKAQVLFERKVFDLTPKQAEEIRKDIQATEQERARAIQEAEKLHGADIDAYLSEGRDAYLDEGLRKPVGETISDRGEMLTLLAQGKSLIFHGEGKRKIYSRVKSWGWTPQTSERLTENYALILAYDRISAHSNSEMLKGVDMDDYSPEGVEKISSNMYRALMNEESALRKEVSQKYGETIESWVQEGYKAKYGRDWVSSIVDSLIKDGSVEFYKVGKDGKKDPSVPPRVLEIPEFTPQRQSLQTDWTIYRAFGKEINLPRSENHVDRLHHLHQLSFDLQRATDPADIAMRSATFDLARRMYESDFGINS